MTSLQRRLVDRYAVDQFDVGWNVRSNRSGLRRRSVTSVEAGRVVDVSVMGAAILAPADPSIVRGATVVIDVAGDRGSVLVRHVRPSQDPELFLYGIEFVDLSPGLRDRLVSPIQFLRRGVPSNEWITPPPEH